MSETVNQSSHDTKNKTVRLGPRTITIPSDWDAVAFEEAIELNPKYTKSDDGPFDYLPMDAVDENKQTIEYWTEREKDDCTTTWFKNGDTVYAKITPCTENGKIAFIQGLKTEVGSGSTEFLVFHPREGVTDERFVYYLANLPDFRSVTISLMEGSTGRQRVPTDVFKKGIKLPLPPLPEQRRIANIISTVDEQIQQTDEIIEKTRELKQGLRQDILIQGLGEHAYKSVNIGPLEYTIPENWSVRPIPEIAKINPVSANLEEYEGTFEYVDIDSVSPGRISGSKTTPIEEAPSRAKRKVATGHVLVSTVRPYLRAFAPVTEEYDGAVCSSGFAVLDAMQGYDKQFLLQVILSDYFLKQMKIRQTGTSYPAVNKADFETIQILCPPLEEQRRIGTRLSAIDKKLDQEREQKKRLQELKRGLMQDLLIGEVRVNSD